MTVTLAEHEIRMACGVAIERRIASIGRLHHAYGYDGTNEWEVEIQSAAAEVALAKALDRYYDGSVNTFKRPDVGDLQVRHTAYPTGHLLVRPHDADDDIFVLVRGRIPTFSVVGWLKGHEAKQEQWARQDDRPLAYFVPESALRWVEEGFAA